MTRPSMSRRIAAAILGADRPGERPSAVARQRGLPLGRRLLASVLGVRASPSAFPASPRDEHQGKAAAPHRDGASRSDSRPDTPSPAPRTQRPKGRSLYNAGSVRPRTPSEEHQEYGSRGAGPTLPLLNEDRPAYERILDDALRQAYERPYLDGAGALLAPEQLRTLALNATVRITADAATEYEHYVQVRQRLRDKASSTESVPGSADPGTGALGRAAMGEADEPGGAGRVAVVAVLLPVLTGGVAVVSLVVGLVLKVLAPEPAFAQIFLTIGWISGAVAGAAILAAAIGLIVTAVRNGATSPPSAEADGLPEQVAQAREAWRRALLERGILPFVDDVLAGPTTSQTPFPSAHRIPRLGYTSPEFSGPDERPATGPRPSFASPDFTSPDFGGPDFGGPAEGAPSTGPDQSD